MFTSIKSYNIKYSKKCHFCYLFNIVAVILFFSFPKIHAQADEDISKYFEETDKFGIGVLRELPADLYSIPDDSSRFTTIALKDSYRRDIITLSPEIYSPLCKPFYYKCVSQPRMYYTDITFRVISRNKEWTRIVFNEETGQTCYIKSDDRDCYQTWEEYFEGKQWDYYDDDGSLIGSSSLPKILIIKYDAPLYKKVNGDEIAQGMQRDFYATRIKGEWIYIESMMYSDDTEKLEGWIKWRDKNKVLITINERWNLR
ncbi:MAG: hypothetical protein E6767_06285 [Dysgonomonas sp.]|nr:hypothetical protein [Dysgonomonas sp.]